MSSIIVQEANGQHRVLESKPFAYEEVLKDSIIQLPSLVPLGSVTDEGVSFLILGEEWPAGTGRADVLLVGSDGILTIVETKLSRNPEARREVVAQVLEYAAYLSESTIFDLQRQAEEFYKKSKKCPEPQKGRSFDENLEAFLDEAASTVSVDSFKAMVEEHLRNGRIRLIVAVDEVGEQAQKIVTFVNSFSTFELYLLQVSAFEDEAGRSIFVPSLHGYARKVATRPPRVQWSWEKYRDEDWPEADVNLAKQLIEGLERVAEGWQPETTFSKRDVNLRCFGRSLFGVELTSSRGLGLWFELASNPGVTLAPGLEVHQTKKYFYLHENLTAIGEDTLLQLCEAALEQAGLLPQTRP
ncbi:MAG: hypothetical protein IH865_04060 [Chloroflexi bacterium]|nr:hypothetical protein [Chloroflexota bacterium]